MKVVVIKRRVIEQENFDSEGDLRDYVEEKVGTRNYKEVLSFWFFNYYIMIVKV